MSMSSVLSGILTVCSLVLLSAGHALAGTPLPVPEPTSLALVAGAVAAVAWAKFRKR
jgi:PEP-CTERM motif-containing protein